MQLLYEIIYRDQLGNEGSFVAGGESVEQVLEMANRTLQQNNWIYIDKILLQGFAEYQIE